MKAVIKQLLSGKKLDLDENTIEIHKPITQEEKIKRLNDYLDRTITKESLSEHFRKYF